MNFVWIALLFAVLLVGITNAQQETEPADVVEQLIEDGVDVKTSLILEEFGAATEQEEESIDDFQPTPTPIPTPIATPVCLSTAQSNVECGASRARVLYDFIVAVDPRAVQKSMHNSLYACMEIDRLSTEYVPIFGSVSGREIGLNIRDGILAGCESVKHPGYVCARDLDLNQCECLNSCETIQNLLAARRLLTNFPGRKP